MLMEGCCFVHNYKLKYIVKIITKSKKPYLRLERTPGAHVFMIRTIKENMYTAVKVILYQVAMCMFGATMSFAAARAESDIILALVSIFSIVFYLFLIYVIFYEQGQKDGIKINAQRLRYDRFKALWISLFANSINILLGVLATVGKLFINGGEHILHNLSNYAEETLSPAWAVDMYEIFSTLSKAVQIMYAGVLKVFFEGNVFMLIAIPLPAIAVSVISYKLGVKFCSGFRNPEGRGQKKKEERYKV